MNSFMSAEYEAEYIKSNGGRMNFKIESVVGCRRLWVVMYNAAGERVDALPCMRLVWGLERRINRKIRRLLRVHAELVALGYRAKL